jgi:AAA domain-containing protein/bifunctional DNA primase/polymerase-like protein
VRPYGDYAVDYLAAGFAPIPARGKRVTKNSHHGRGKPWVTQVEAERWAALHGDANIAARLPRDAIGIDVDAYGTKPGEETLAALEADLGPLPATVVSTSRFDGVSGIRLFRLPDEYWPVIWPGKAGDGIEIIWTGNRYMIVWPSVHPDTGERYLWYEQNDDMSLEPIDGIPDISVLPFLPRDWCDHFARSDQQDELADVASPADWIKQHGTGVMCAQMRLNLERATDGLSINAHDSCRDGTLAIAKDTAAGHSGGATAMGMLFKAFAAELGERSHARRIGAASEWKRHLNGAVRRAAALLGAGGRPADPCSEMAALGSARPIVVSGAVLWADDVEETRLRWLQKPLIAFGTMSIIDGDPSQGKTLLTQTAVANATNGLPLFPYGDHCGFPIKCGIIGAEDDLNSVVVGRLRAAGWERGSRSVAFYKVPTKRGKIVPLSFPQSAEPLRAWILTAGLEFVVVDPITSFLGEDVKSYNDASVRTALGPLGEIARETGCAILLVRHLNKSGDMKAMYRGGGSIAFSALARSVMITGVMPDSQPDDRKFAMAQVKCNNAEMMPVSLAYSVHGWGDDPSIPVIRWHGEAAVSADQLVAGPQSKRGPESESQSEIREILEDLFAQRDTWSSVQIKAIVRKAGHREDSQTVKKVKRELGIVSRRLFRRGEIGDGTWVWTTSPDKLKRGG